MQAFFRHCQLLRPGTNQTQYCPMRLQWPLCHVLYPLQSGVVPSDWSIGHIIPLYKKKGSVDNVDNYRGITILSCLGKTFTAVLNTRLTMFLADSGAIGPEQAGFKAGHSTIDHVFVLNALINLYLNKKKTIILLFHRLQKSI